MWCNWPQSSWTSCYSHWAPTHASACLHRRRLPVFSHVPSCTYTMSTMHAHIHVHHHACHQACYHVSSPYMHPFFTLSIGTYHNGYILLYIFNFSSLHVGIPSPFFSPCWRTSSVNIINLSTSNEDSTMHTYFSTLLISLLLMWGYLLFSSLYVDGHRLSTYNFFISFARYHDAWILVYTIIFSIICMWVYLLLSFLNVNGQILALLWTTPFPFPPRP